MMQEIITLVIITLIGLVAAVIAQYIMITIISGGESLKEDWQEFSKKFSGLSGRARGRSRGLGEKVAVATISGVLIFIILRALGIDTELRLLAIPIGVIVIYLGLSIF